MLFKLDLSSQGQSPKLFLEIWTHFMAGPEREQRIVKKSPRKSFFYLMQKKKKENFFLHFIQQQSEYIVDRWHLGFYTTRFYKSLTLKALHNPLKAGSRH